jgi:hypothetical protein
VPLWTGASTLGNSVIAQAGSSIGIGTAAPATTLDVNGASTLRGSVSLPAASTATATAGVSSAPLQLGASSFSSATKAAVAQNFQWQTVAAGNNTASPTANLSLLFGSGATAPKAIGLSIAPNGQIAFAPGQTFPGAGGGSISAIVPSSPLTGGGTSGSVPLGLNEGTLTSDIAPGIATAITPTLTNTFNSQYAQLSAFNTFTGRIDVLSDYGGIYAENQKGGDAIYGWGVDHGVVGVSTGGASGQVGVFGQQDGGGAGWDNTYLWLSDYNWVAGVWGNAVDSLSGTQVAGVIGTVDNGAAGVFVNDASSIVTLSVENRAGGPQGLFKTFRASTPDGTCGFGSGGSLACTGQVKSLADAGNGTRKVETYSMQSPENWMEDFGSGVLERGVATIKIDPTFAETVSQTADYHVFLTATGDSKGLYVIRKTAASFEVRESGGGVSSLAFDYRIVAKRRGFEAQRHVDVTENFRAATERTIPIRKSAQGGQPVPMAPRRVSPKT